MRRGITLMTFLLVLLGIVGPLAADPLPEHSTVVLTWEEFVHITGFDPNQKGGQVLTIPWTEVQSLLGVQVERMGDATTVDLPWNEFKALMQWSIGNEARKQGVKPPVDYVVTSTEYTGELSDEGAKMVLKLSLEALGEGTWKRIQVLPSTVAVTKSTLPSGVFLNAAGHAYELLTKKTGRIDATLEFSVDVQKNKGINQVNFSRVAQASSVLDLTIDRADVDVKVGGAQSLLVKTDGDRTRVAAAIPSGSPVLISWERALPKVEATPTKLYAETRTLVAVAEGALLCNETVMFNILHTAVHDLKLEVPAQANILTVTGANVQDWRVDKKGELLVVLRGEALGTQELNIAYEGPAGDQVNIPVIRAAGVEREKGFVGVVAVSNLEIKSEGVSGARSIDARQLPGELVAMTKQPILMAFRYAGETFTIPLTMKKHRELGMVVTIVDSTLFTVMQLNDGRRITKAVYSVRNNRNQFLRITMPEGAEIWSVEVAGKSVSPAKDETGNVLLPLVRSASMAQELASFPVEMVYVEAPETAAPADGTLKVVFPSADVPAMHYMVRYYLPDEGDYKSLFGGSYFTGPMHKVDYFTDLVAGPGQDVVYVDAAEEANQMQNDVAAQVDAQARAAGAQPIRVRLPVNGQLFLFEKILVLPGDTMWLSIKYRDWDVAEE